MSEGKAANESEIVIGQNEVAPSVDSSKPRPYRKYVIIAVTAVVVAAIILIAILVGMYLFTEGQKEILQFSYTRDGNVKEEVISDPNTNIVQYHVNDPAYELWIVDDFNRDIEVMKAKGAWGTKCYVAPLNRTRATDPSKVSLPTNIKKQNVSYIPTYRASDTPIPDTSFLSKAAKDACQTISTYWVYPSCETPRDPSESLSRQKRGRCCPKLCWALWCLEYCWDC
jgi:hypothetical protein